MQLSLNSNWPAAQERWDAFWRREHRGRPIMHLVAPRAQQEPVPQADDLEQYYFDPDFLYRRYATQLRNQHFLAESLPCTQGMMAGWLLAYGQKLVLRPDTIWFEPMLGDGADAPDWDLWDHPQFRRLQRILTEVGDRAAGEFMVGLPPTLPPNDLLSVLTGPERFLVNLALEPERVQDALRRMTDSYVRQHRAMREVVGRHFEGVHHHYSAWGKRVISFQSDVSCMLSPAMFERFIVPELEAISAELGPAIYHLDGPGAIHHLERLCDIPGIRMIQWEPGAGNPYDFEHWPQVFKRTQERGKAIMLPLAPARLEQAIRQFRPDLTFIICWAGSYEQAESLLENAERWTAEYWG